jgi:excisionase family DNA binding protein
MVICGERGRDKESRIEEGILVLADQIEKIGRALSAKDLAKLLSVSEVTIFKHAAAGRIPSFRIGTCLRFDPRAVANWLRGI